MLHKYFLLMALVVSLIASSCASRTAVYPDPVNIQSVIKPGDIVKIVTEDNRETEFVVTEVTDEAILGENQKVLFTDITEFQEQTVSAGANFGIIVLITLGVAGGAAAGAVAGAAAVMGGGAAVTAVEAAGVAGGAVGAAGATGRNKKDRYEYATKWYGCSSPYPKYHPGDVYATESGTVYTAYTAGYTASGTIYTAGSSGIDETLCFEECKSGYKNIDVCRFECIEKGHPVGDIAEHIEGGYYSDGSYYAKCSYPFENIHPTKDKYEKTNWQKDRDECIDLVSEISARSPYYYRRCLKEKGYSIRLN